MRSKPQLRQLHLRYGFSGKPGVELIEHRNLDPDLARQSLRARIARRPHDLRQALAIGQHRAGEHFRLHLPAIGFIEVDFHQQGTRVAVGVEHHGSERIVARPQHVDGAEQIDGVVLAVQLPQRVLRGVGVAAERKDTAPSRLLPGRSSPGRSSPYPTLHAAAQMLSAPLPAERAASPPSEPRFRSCRRHAMRSAGRPAAACRPHSARSSAGIARRSTELRYSRTLAAHAVVGLVYVTPRDRAHMGMRIDDAPQFVRICEADGVEPAAVHVDRMMMQAYHGVGGRIRQGLVEPCEFLRASSGRRHVRDR